MLQESELDDTRMDADRERLLSPIEPKAGTDLDFSTHSRDFCYDAVHTIPYSRVRACYPNGVGDCSRGIVFRNTLQRTDVRIGKWSFPDGPRDAFAMSESRFGGCNLYVHLFHLVRSIDHRPVSNKQGAPLPTVEVCVLLCPAFGETNPEDGTRHCEERWNPRFSPFRRSSHRFPCVLEGLHGERSIDRRAALQFLRGNS